MVVLLICICTKAGKPIISRQFANLDKRSVEGLIQEFSSLLTTQTQHTFIDPPNSSYRFIYHPLDAFYLLLICSKSSNIIENFDTLNNLKKIYSLYCSTNSESSIISNSFNLLFAWDELICMGIKEPVNLMQIKTMVEMDSQEEKLTQLITESKISDAREEARKKAKLIDARKMQMKKEKDTRISNSSISYDTINNFDAVSNTTKYSGVSNDSSSSWAEKKVETSFYAKPDKKPINKGMKLSKSKPAPVEVFTPTNIAPKQSDLKDKNSLVATKDENHNAPTPDAITIFIDEKYSLSMEPDSTIRKQEIKGVLSLIVKDPDRSRLSIQLKDSLLRSSFQFNPHPKLNRDKFSSQCELISKDTSRPFPIGSDNQVVLLRYRGSPNPDKIPITASFWADIQGNQTIINIGCQANINLSNVVFIVPCPSLSRPVVTQCQSPTSYNLDVQKKLLIWTVGSIDADVSYSIEFSINESVDDQNSFLPIEIHFGSNHLYSGLQVDSVKNALDPKQLFPFIVNTSLADDKYIVE